MIELDTRPAPVEVVTPIKLPSEAIRLGCLLRPRQITGHRFDGEDGACASGAMFVGGGLGTEPVAYLHWDRWPGLMQETVLPEPCVSHGARKKLVIGYVVEHLNDSEHHWSRERIASWLEGLGL